MQELGQFGVWTTYRTIGEENAGDAARLLEQLGFGTFWLGGSQQLPALRPILEATDRLVAATGILNVWASDPDQVAADYAELASDFGDRVLLGIGIGHPEATTEYRTPLTAMREFLDRLDAAPTPVPSEGRCLAALGPKMLRLSADRSRGAHPYFVPVEHVRFARQQLGEGPLLAPELTCVVDEDPEAGAAQAHAFAERYLGLRNYVNNLLRLGFTEQDVAGSGSARLIDAVVPHGSAEEIAVVARQFLDAGADHVCLQAAGATGIPRAQWTALASALGLGA